MSHNNLIYFVELGTIVFLLASLYFKINKRFHTSNNPYLYKYFLTRYARDVIENARIKVSGPKDFNDPFEFLPSIVDSSYDEIERGFINNDELLRDLHESSSALNKPSLEQIKKDLRDSIKRKTFIENIRTKSTEILKRNFTEAKIKYEQIALIACFGGHVEGVEHEILMWAHYADSNKGIRIVFNKESLVSNPVNLIEIEYQSRQPQYKSGDYWKHGKKRQDFLNKIIRTVLRVKSEVWSYEKEKRWLVPRQSVNIQNIDGREIMFVPINLKSIVGIDFGLKCDSRDIQEIKDLVNRHIRSTVIFRKAEIDTTGFKIKYIEC